MDDSKLIYLVEQNDELYNKRNQNYKFPDRKRAIWSKIAKDMSATDEQCIRRWTSLRDRYARECRQNNQPSGSGSLAKSTWPFFDSMQFLKAHIAARQTRCSTNITFDGFDFSPDSPPLPSKSSSPAISKCESQQIQKGNKKRKLDVDTVFLEAVESFKKVCGQRELRNPNPSVQAFGDMIVSTVCDMTSEYQTLAMKKVTEIIMNLKQESDLSQYAHIV